MKILGIAGSKRKTGNTATLVNEALNEAKKEGIDTEIIYLGDYHIKGCLGCEKCKDSYTCIIEDDMQKIYPKIMEADGIILGSPTYFYNITSDVKAFIERLYCYEILDESNRAVWMSLNEALGGKYAVTIAICEQQNEKDMGSTSKVMDLSLTSLGYRIVDSVKILNLFDISAAKHSDDAKKRSRRAGSTLVKTLLLKENILKCINNRV